MKEIDVEKVLASKSPKLAARVPRFAINYLKHIVHQDELNYIITNFADDDPFPFIRHALQYFGISYHSVGMDRIERGGRYVFASNHPFGGLDGLMLADEVYKQLGDARVIVNDLLMNVEPLRPIFVPVNKHGRQNGDNLRAFNEAFASDLPIVTFPAGLCSRRHKGVVADLVWKTNFVKKAIASNRDIVPVHFDGRLSEFFYRLSNLRKRLGVKANVEMLYLVDEMIKQRGSNFEIRVGDPVAWSELNDGRSPIEITEHIRRLSYGLMKK